MSFLNILAVLLVMLVLEHKCSAERAYDRGKELERISWRRIAPMERAKPIGRDPKSFKPKTAKPRYRRTTPRKKTTRPQHKTQSKRKETKSKLKYRVFTRISRKLRWKKRPTEKRPKDLKKCMIIPCRRDQDCVRRSKNIGVSGCRYCSVVKRKCGTLKRNRINSQCKSSRNCGLDAFCYRRNEHIPKRVGDEAGSSTCKLRAANRECKSDSDCPTVEEIKGEFDEFRKAGKKVLTFVGFSGQLYRDPEKMLQDARNEIEKYARENNNNIVINAGGTKEGIGEVYELAKKMGFPTTGIVSRLSQDYQSAIGSDETFYTKGHWGGRNEKNELHDSSQAMVSVSDKIVGIGGGPVAKIEMEEAEKRRIPVHRIPAEPGKTLIFKRSVNSYSLDWRFEKDHSRQR